jgi:hypothetical protein
MNIGYAEEEGHAHTVAIPISKVLKTLPCIWGIVLSKALNEVSKKKFQFCDVAASWSGHHP